MLESVDLCSLIEEFRSEDKCREYLEALRWADGIMCPRCRSCKISQIIKRNQYDCDKCRYQFSVTAGTIFNDSHLPLWKWFLSVYLLCESKEGMSASQIKRTLGISYKTAWYLCHRIRAAMQETSPQKLGGIFEEDETVIGGCNRGESGRSGRNKQIVVGIKQRNGKLRFFKAEEVASGTLARYIRANVRGDVEMILTDEWKGFPKAAIMAGIHGNRHETVCHRNQEHARGGIASNGIESALSLFKRGIIGSWRKVSARHLAAYLDEMTFRFNNRTNPFLFRDTLIKLLGSPVLEYKKLIAA